MPGVVAVFTGADLGSARYFVFCRMHPECAGPPLAKDKVRFVGETVAVVVAETRAQALDAAEVVIVDYDPLPAVIDVEAALGARRAGAVRGHRLQRRASACARPPDADPLAGADVVVRAPHREPAPRASCRWRAPRSRSSPATTASATRSPCTRRQMPHRYAARSAEPLGLEPDELRVIAPDVGGSFGAKHGRRSRVRVVAASAVSWTGR